MWYFSALHFGEIDVCLYIILEINLVSEDLLRNLNFFAGDQLHQKLLEL